MKKLLALAASTVALSGAAQAQEAIAISDLNWNGAKAIGYVIKGIIEGPMGGEANIIQGMNNQAVIYEGMDKGDGSVDIHTDMWMPNHQASWDKYVEEAGTIRTNSPYQGTSNIYVPAFASDLVSSIEDLADPAVAALFDTDGDGLGEYWPGASSWASTKRWQIKFKSYGLDNLWEPNIVEADVFKASLDAAYNAGEPMLFYYWTPEAIHVKYDLSVVEEPARFPGCEDVDLDAENWLEVSTFECVIASNDVYVAHSASLEERNPAVAQMLSNIQLDGQMVAGWISAIFEEGKDPADVAADWIAENEDLVNSWING